MICIYYRYVSSVNMYEYIIHIYSIYIHTYIPCIIYIYYVHIRIHVYIYIIYKYVNVKKYTVDRRT